MRPQFITLPDSATEKNPANLPIYIYGLCDPDTGDIRYVGQTQKPLNERLQAHRLPSDVHPQSTREKWLYELACAKKRPTIGLLEVTTLVHAAEREQYHIDSLRDQGCILTNSEARRPYSRRVGQGPRDIREERRQARMANDAADCEGMEIDHRKYLTIPEAAALLNVHKNTIRNRLIKLNAYTYDSVLTPQGKAYKIDRVDFYAKHPELNGPAPFVGDKDAIEGPMPTTRFPLPPQKEPATALMILPTSFQAIVRDEIQKAVAPVQEAALRPLAPEAVERLDAIQDSLERIHEALRVSHEDNQMLRQQMTQMQQQQAVIYHEVRQRRGRGVLHVIGRLVGL